MQRGRVGDREFWAKMAELRLFCDKEIEIQQQRMETASQSFRKSLQIVKSSAQETVLNQEKIGKLRSQLRAVEDDLVKALSVKTRKEAKKMATSDSIFSTKGRNEEHKKIVADQRTRKDEFSEIISHQLEVLKECEEKHKQDAERRGEVEEAISWYNRVLGFRIERGHGVKFIFTNINLKNPNEEYYFTIRLEKDNYKLLDCHPHVSDAKKLIQELNITNGLYNFVRIMRAKFQEITAGGSLQEIALQEMSIISMSAPISLISTDSGSGTPAKEDHSRQTNRVLRKARNVQRGQSSILSPGSASSLRKSPRFKVTK